MHDFLNSIPNMQIRDKAIHVILHFREYPDL